APSNRRPEARRAIGPVAPRKVKGAATSWCRCTDVKHCNSSRRAGVDSNAVRVVRSNPGERSQCRAPRRTLMKKITQWVAVVAGAVLAVAAVRTVAVAAESAAKGDRIQHRVERMKERLSLSDDQARQIAQLFRDA